MENMEVAVPSETTTHVEKKPGRPAKPKMVRVRLLRNYRPKNDFLVMDRQFPEDPHSPLEERKPIGEKDKFFEDPETGLLKIVRHATGEFAKVKAIAFEDDDPLQIKTDKKLPKITVKREIKLEIDEARYVLAKGIAERADDLTVE